MTRVLFLAHNRRGLGHIMRGLNIARAVRAAAPRAEMRFFARSASAAMLGGGEFSCMVDTSAEWEAGWARMLRVFDPDVAVYDTLLPQGALPRANATVYVMRRCKPERQAAIFASPFLDGVDSILIPHTAEEFGYEVPDRLASRCQYVGPIVRPLDAQIQAQLRAHYTLDDAAPLVISTVGGGGFAEDATSFFALVSAVHAELRDRCPTARHIVVRGPHFQGDLSALPGMTVVAHEPELGNLMALASVVVAQGGYNTVQELRLARVPAAFLPGERGYDDQEERVRALETRGAAAVFTSRDPAVVAPRIAALACDTARLATMRAAYGAPLVTGNAAAATAIIALATTSCALGCW